MLSGAKAGQFFRSPQELPNAYFVAKFRFDTAENEPDNSADSAAVICGRLAAIKILKDGWLT